MTDDRIHSNTDTTKPEATDSLLTKKELEEMGWSSDAKLPETDAGRVHMIVGSLAETSILTMEEAQAFAFCEIAGAGVERTAAETGMFPSAVENQLWTARKKVNSARHLMELLEHCDC